MADGSISIGKGSGRKLQRREQEIQLECLCGQIHQYRAAGKQTVREQERGGYMKAVIMAGGRGTRLSPLAPDLPKPMVKIAGKPVL